MDTRQANRDLRREAIRRRLEGERRCDICEDLDCSPRWVSKWWAVYQHDPTLDLADHSRAPHTSPHQTPAAIERAIVSIRKTLEAGTTPETRYGLIGPAVIQARLESLGLRPPSRATIQRILHAHDLTHPIGAGKEAAFYPWLAASEVNAAQATDIITRHLQGGAEIQNVHTIDLGSYAVSLSQHDDKSAPTIVEHLRCAWSHLGLPELQQFDNEESFRGGHTHPRVIGQVVRLCLFCGVEPLFIPYREAKRNHQIETFHSIWNPAFWSRREFQNCAEVQAESPNVRAELSKPVQQIANHSRQDHPRSDGEQIQTA